MASCLVESASLASLDRIKWAEDENRVNRLHHHHLLNSALPARSLLLLLYVQL